ncbi:hypothetical protein I4U23_010914 [Adineta vaga]|nr:hypothetical protein I4U23_010914 [Adineta vaga]
MAFYQKPGWNQLLKVIFKGRELLGELADKLEIKSDFINCSDRCYFFFITMMSENMDDIIESYNSDSEQTSAEYTLNNNTGHCYNNKLYGTNIGSSSIQIIKFP